MEGNILVDSISRLAMTLGKNSRWDGALLQETNDQGHDKDAGADLTIEKGATWNMTADSTVRTLRSEGKIVTNGHTLTVLKKYAGMSDNQTVRRSDALPSFRGESRNLRPDSFLP